MKPDGNEEAIKTTKEFQEIISLAGLINRSVFDESTKRFRYEWTPDGVRFRDAILKTYDAIAKTDGANASRKLYKAVAFVIIEER